MKKAYVVQNAAEFKQITDEIYSHGYEKSLIVQDFIPGDDSHMRVLTCYSDQNGKVKMMCLGHVLLEEHTPKGIGNHAAIITEYDEEVMTKFKNFLESINYTGFSNFDIKYDTRDNSYKVFEINLRQGRSNYYVTGSGNNIAEYVVKDRVENKELELKENIDDGIDFNIEANKKLGEETIADESEIEENYIEADEELEDEDNLLFEDVADEDDEDLLIFDNDLAEDNILSDEDIIDEE